MPIFIGTDKLGELHIGTDKVKEIYIGTDKVYSSSIEGDPILFNSGVVSGIPWSANMLTRPNNHNPYYTGNGGASADPTKTGMSAWVDGNDYSFTFNHHVCTTNLITIPSSATMLKVKVKSWYVASNGHPTMKFGLLPVNAPNALSATNGGKLSSNIVVNSTSWTDYSLELNSGMAGTNLYRVVINNVSPADTSSSRLTKELDIRKVWFE